jgi:hypothetical protein
MSRRRRTIAIDFDGVMHTYDGFKGIDVFGEPLPLARERVEQLLARGHDVVVFTTRVAALVREWLQKYDFPALSVTSTKQPFWVIIDDRALRFEGDWERLTVQDIEAAEPYWVSRRETS